MKGSSIRTILTSSFNDNGRIIEHFIQTRIDAGQNLEELLFELNGYEDYDSDDFNDIYYDLDSEID